MRDPVTTFYYPSAFLPGLTLAKSVLLFDELHLMDRPSFTFVCYGGHFGMVGTESPLRQYEEAFRREGFPLYVHDAPGGLVSGDLLEQIDADVRDQTFLQTFQGGPVSHEDIRASMRIRRTARKAIADYVTGLSGIRARAGDRSEISHLQDRAEMPREKQPPPSTLIRPQDLHTIARPDFIDDIVRELTEGE